MSDVVSRILIQCPTTGDPVETVLRLRPSAFQALKGEYRFRCPKCAEVHSWRREEAWLEALSPRHM